MKKFEVLKNGKVILSLGPEDLHKLSLLNLFRLERVLKLIEKLGGKY